MILAGCCAILALSLAPAAQAFFPLGGFNLQGQLRLIQWPFFEFDTNNDGQIVNGEGLEILIEGGKSGYSAEEIVDVKEAFQVWQDVPTTYASFRFGGIVEDPIFVATTTTPDFMTVMALQVTTSTSENVVPDPADILVPELVYPVLGLTLPLFIIEDEILTVGGQSYVIGAGTMVDCDIVLDATSSRSGVVGVEPEVDLKSVMVHEIGHLLGLGHTPVNNLRVVETEPGSGSVGDLIENEVFWLTGVDGIGRYIGATPTMFPFYFDTINGSGSRHGGTLDLAPDDISGISYLYPRGSQSNFFTVKQEVRTHTRPGTGLPSLPLPGAHVVAWADVDNDPNTPRIALFSTMAGLYEKVVNEELAGRFELQGLWKQAEVPGANGAMFNPSYAITANPLNQLSFERQAPPGYDVSEYDSIQGKGSLSTAQRSLYVTAFASEVFHEAENITDIGKKDAGTPLVWSFDRNTLISSDTQRTLPEILPNNKPMFGDPNDVCPLNVISEGTGTTTTTATAGMLRKFRDRMLNSSAGAAIVGAYYQVSPHVARFLLAHHTAFRLFRNGVHGMYWLIEHSASAVGLLAAGAALLWFGVRRRKRAMAAMLLVLGMTLWAASAHGFIAQVTTAEMAASADEIVTGTITSAESRWARGGRIYTDVVLEIKDTAKGNLNKSSSVSFSVIGGQIGGFVYRPSEIPLFVQGENVLLYLRHGANDHLVLHGGLRGRFAVFIDETTGKSYVTGGSEIGDAALAEDAKAMAKDQGVSAAKNEDKNKISLDQYLEYLRDIVRAEEKAKNKP